MKRGEEQEQTKLLPESGSELTGTEPQSAPDSCVFCGIVRGDVVADVVFRESSAIAFLDRKPVFLGHCLVIPSIHVQTLADLPMEVLPELFRNVQRLSRAVETALGADGTFVAINNKVSQSVPHLHVHVVPRKFGDGLRGFFWPRQSYRNEREKEEIKVAIAKALSVDYEPTK